MGRGERKEEIVLGNYEAAALIAELKPTNNVTGANLNLTKRGRRGLLCFVD